MRVPGTGVVSSGDRRGADYVESAQLPAGIFSEIVSSI